MIEKINKDDKVHGLSTTVIIDKINEIIDFLNDTYLMKLKDGQHITTVDDIFVTGTTIIDNNIAEPIEEQLVCPHCGASYYTELYSTSTAVYYPPIYKNGVNINPNQNQASTFYECMACGKRFSI